MGFELALKGLALLCATALVQGQTGTDEEWRSEWPSSLTNNVAAVRVSGAKAACYTQYYLNNKMPMYDFIYEVESSDSCDLICYLFQSNNPVKNNDCIASQYDKKSRTCFIWTRENKNRKDGGLKLSASDILMDGEEKGQVCRSMDYSKLDNSDLLQVEDTARELLQTRIRGRLGGSAQKKKKGSKKSSISDVTTNAVTSSSGQCEESAAKIQSTTSSQFVIEFVTDATTCQNICLFSRARAGMAADTVGNWCITAEHHSEKKKCKLDFGTNQIDENPSTESNSFITCYEPNKKNGDVQFNNFACPKVDACDQQNKPVVE